MKFEIEIDLARVEESVVEELRGPTWEHINEKVKIRIGEIIDERMTIICEEYVRKGIDEFVSKVWQKTDNWGEPTGEAVNFSERLKEICFKDRYGRSTSLDDSMTEKASEIFNTYFKDEIALAKQKFREAIDSIIQAKVQTLLREAVGVK